MPFKYFFVLVVCLAFVSVSFGTTDLSAQLFTIPWYTIDSGGGYSASGKFEVEGTIGQPHAGPVMSGGNFELTGGFWVATTHGPIQTIPDSFLVTRGTHISGGVVELAESDNADLSIRRAAADIQSRTEFELKAVSPVAIPSSLEVTLEGSVFARIRVDQTIELFDYVAAVWEEVDTRVATRFTDSVVMISATGDLSRFVEAGTMCIKARVRYESSDRRQRFSSNTDRFIWMMGQ